MERRTEETERRRKKWLLSMLLLLMGVLLLFTLFSNTLQSVTLPKVRAETMTVAGVTYKLEGRGVMQPVRQAELPNPAGWKVRQVLVKQGDTVKKGQKLVLYDSSSAKRELEDEIVVHEKMSVALLGMDEQFKRLMFEGNESEAQEIRRAIKTQQLDLSIQQRKIDALREQLNQHSGLNAPFDGVVTEMNAVEGLAAIGEPDMVIANRAAGYRLDLTVDTELLDRLGLEAGQSIELSLEAKGEQAARSLEGTILEVIDTDPRAPDSIEGNPGTQPAIGQTQLRIHVVDDMLKGGERASVKLERASEIKGWLIPQEAIHREGDSLFLFTVYVQRGALGNVFVARKVPVEAIETTEQQTMIAEDRLYEGDLVILDSSEPLQDGNRIRLN